MRVNPSTASTAIWTIGGGGCPNDYVTNCPNSRGGLFLINESLTWAQEGIYNTALEVNLGMDSAGYAGFDTVTLGWQGSGGPTVEHTTILNLADSQYWLGVFPLNPRPTNFTGFTDPQTSFLQVLKDNYTIPSLSYGFTAGNQYRLDKVYGSLTLGGYDSNRFTPTNITWPFYEDISRDLSVNLQAITTDKTTPSNLLPGGSISIFIDSTVPEIWLPASACSAFEQAFGIGFNDNYQRYIINSTHRQTLLDQDASVTFKLGTEVTGGSTVDIVLPYSAFDLQVQFPIVENPNTSYYFPLMKAVDNGTVNQYTLGRTFLQEAYLIADYERQNFTVQPCEWDASKVSNQDLVPILSTNATSSSDSSEVLSSGAIAGVAVGVAGAVGILGVTLFFLRRHKNKSKRAAAELEAKEAGGAGKTSDEHGRNGGETKPFISHPMGGELGGGEIHELNAPQKHHAQEMDSPHRMDPNRAGYSEMEGEEYFGPGKIGRGYATEVQGDTPIFEMVGSGVHEMPTPERRPSK